MTGIRDNMSPKEFADVIHREQTAMLKQRINSISIKGGGSFRVNGGNGKFVISRDEQVQGLPTSEIREPNIRATYTPVTINGINYVYIDSPQILISAPSGGSTTWHYPTMGGSSMMATPRPKIAVGSGVKIYIKFTATVAEAAFRDEFSAPPTTTNVKNSITLSDYSFQYGNYAYEPSSSGLSGGLFTTGANTVYMLVARIDSGGELDSLSGAEWTDEYTRNSMSFSTNNFNWFTQKYLIY